MKILMADDETDFLMLFREMLIMKGHCPIITDKMKDVAHLADLNIPDAIVLDYMMGDCCDEITKLRSCLNTKDTPIVIYTGAKDVSVDGADEVVEKPVSLHDLIAKVKGAINDKRKQLSQAVS